ncbi:MAG: GNAT family N-acetyltransferase [Parvularcula sp.]|jgi:RimJ/RimL family protein N-acetyltransferase|nr:GNAT family N-acetyltransferase [Parvularcula sp.]
MGRPDNDLFFFAVLAGRDLAGFVTLHTFRDGEAELAYWIGKPFAGQGFGTEAARALCRAGFRRKRLRTIRTQIFLDNIASLRIAKKTGMRRCFVLMDDAADRIGPSPSAVYSLSRENLRP